MVTTFVRAFTHRVYKVSNDLNNRPIDEKLVDHDFS